MACSARVLLNACMWCSFSTSQYQYLRKLLAPADGRYYSNLVALLERLSLVLCQVFVVERQHAGACSEASLKVTHVVSHKHCRLGQEPAAMLTRFIPVIS